MDLVQAGKNCSQCKQHFLITNFYPEKHRQVMGYTSQCKQCSIKHSVAWGKRNPAKKRNNHLKSMYGITLEIYNKMFTEQKGCCAICNRHQSEFKKALHVDHRHSDGIIRKLLCVHCNRTIGQYKDNPELFDKFADYLRSA